MNRRSFLIVIGLFTTTTIAAPSAQTQVLEPIEIRTGEIYAGSGVEEYLRILQVSGRAVASPWSLRPSSPSADAVLLGSVVEHPWQDRWALGKPVEDKVGAYLLRPVFRASYNSAFPYGMNDGAMWAGRGATLAGRAGMRMYAGPVSLTIAPEVFWAQNGDFEIVDNNLNGPAQYGDPWLPQAIDLPQRFGSSAYARVGSGQSELRVDALGVGIGVGTANQYWGPAQRHPIILGNNAAGFENVFLGTSKPVTTVIGAFHTRAMWGRLRDSGYSSIWPDSSNRLMAGLAAVYMPRGITGLEIGGSRFYHFPWARDSYTLERLLKPFGSILKKGTPDPKDEDLGRSYDNQLASVFFRWVAPASGFEFYGEYGREDHNWNIRDFILEPDHTGGYMVGFQRVFDGQAEVLYAVRAELLNTQISHLQNVRLQQPFYAGSPRQGHTHRGQILGSAYGYGGAATIIEVDRYSENGRWRVGWARNLRDHQARRMQVDEERDLMHTLGVEWFGWRSRMELNTGALINYNQNRNYLGDKWSLNATFGITYTIND